MNKILFLFSIIGLSGCVKDMPPMADTSNAAQVTYTKISFAPGERQSLWMFDNREFKDGVGSGRLIEHGNFARQSASVYVPAGGRKYFKASYVLAEPAVYGFYSSVSQCSAGVSFIPERDKRYVLTQQSSVSDCVIKLVDEENSVPATFIDLGVLE